MSRARRLQAANMTPIQGLLLSWGPSNSNPGVTAAGTTISDATSVSKPVIVVTGTASNTGIKLTEEISDELVIVKNSGANTLKIYPDSASNTINGGAAGAAATLATTKTAILFKVSSSAWHSVTLD